MWVKKHEYFIIIYAIIYVVLWKILKAQFMKALGANVI